MGALSNILIVAYLLIVLALIVQAFIWLFNVLL